MYQVFCNQYMKNIIDSLCHSCGCRSEFKNIQPRDLTNKFCKKKKNGYKATSSNRRKFIVSTISDMDVMFGICKIVEEILI